VEQVVRLIRSKGVGVYFVTQNPLDLPESVLGQLGNRVQHALRAFTPRDQKAVKAAAETFRPNPRFKTQDAIMELGVGEALVSTLQDGGVPAVVDRVKIRPPRSRMGALTADERTACLQHSPFNGKYEQVQDRESAYEMLAAQAPVAAPPPAASSPGTLGNWWESMSRQQVPGAPAPSPEPTTRRAPPPPAQPRAPAAPRASNRQSVAEAAVKSVIRSAGSQVGREIGRQLLRGVLGSLSRR
jgi:DNA helicase HerA-like ATPase